ncbi:MAG: alpha-mannosidase [Chloroflexi bacterium]|nr:alpha-mannosidase [Chloroflexota bacterium]
MHHRTHWTADKIEQRIALITPLIHRRRQPLAPWRYRRLDGPDEPAPLAADTPTDDWELVAGDAPWSAWRENVVLHGWFAVPPDWDAAAPLMLHLPLGVSGDFDHPEALVYLDGVPLAGCDRQHHELLLPEHCRAGRRHHLALHGWVGGIWRHDAQPRPHIGSSALVQIDAPTRALVALARVALGVARGTDAVDPARGRLLNALDAAFRLLDLGEPFGERFYASVPAALARLRAGIADCGAPLDVGLVATGHAHIDVAWLWTLGQTRRKVERTFATALRLMDEFPEYHFTQSQPQLYAWLAESQPALLERIRQRVAEGRWEPIGGMWVEADCNLSGAEALARQFVLGRGLFRQLFGAAAESPVLWLPDVFGYAWALPQLIRAAGLEYFFTIKIGWSQYNRLPYDTFWWQGIDGTRVLTHFSTTPEMHPLVTLPMELRQYILDALGRSAPYASTYNAAATPEQVLGTWSNFQQKETHRDLLMAFGFGDGGGGPTRTMLENLRELAAFPAAPRVRQQHVGAFFDGVEREAGATLPTWNGELYLELHRGTYTTQSRNKRANRVSEFLLHDAEWLATLAGTLDAGYRYPAADLQRAWQLVCLNQFHDIIPGSSIREVYVESLAQYAEIASIGRRVRDGALAALAARAPAQLIIANPTGFTQRGLVHWQGAIDPEQRLVDAAGVSIATQAVADGTLLACGALQPLGISGVWLGGHGEPAPYDAVVAGERWLENAFVRVELDGQGDICRIFDKRVQREVLPPGARANQFQAFEDRPLNWDAWDIDIFFDEKLTLAQPARSIRLTEHGPLRATITIERCIGHSCYTQRISLCYDSARIDVQTVIDWRERHTLLKVAFPVDVLAPQATYEIQWGHVARPTHRNTSWDWARFETCAQKWVDLSEDDYGVSIMNDSKYGHDIRDQVMRVSLLRSPTMPDPEADQGEQVFTVAILPHLGPWGDETLAEAYRLNDPPLVATAAGVGDALPPPLLLADRTSVVVETVKRAEDGDGIVVRLFESRRRRGEVRFTAGIALASVEQTNLLEDAGTPIATDGRHFSLTLRPFEIATLRLRPQ